MRRFISIIICALPVLAAAASCGRFGDAPRVRPVTRIELASGWRFKEAGGDRWMPATVPGCVHTDLFAAGAIPDPFFGENEKDLQWVGEREWIYECEFSAGDGLLGHERVEIAFEGLDTYAEVSLNGSPVIKADNMFRRWTADIKPLLKSGANRLEVRFLPPGPVEASKREALGYALPGGDRVFTRKAAYHYGWDWGPRLVTCGVWRPVTLTGWSNARIVRVSARTRSLSERGAVVEVKLYLEKSEDLPAMAVITEQVSGLSETVDMDTRLKESDHKLSEDGNAEFYFGDPPLWWPAGLGEQNLQRYSVEIFCGEARVDSLGITTGIRDIELVTEDDGSGESFYFRVNGVPVFMKGANWIPAHSFTPEAGREEYLRLICAAKDANMNMLRVWGGGIYEDDIFYGLCDSLGILVWQDFMYACSMYPGDGVFISNAQIEAKENLLRLLNHPCIALYCGNNESGEGWLNWGWQDVYDDRQREAIWRAYRNLFDGVLPKTIFSNRIPQRYWPSSPRFGRADPRSLTEGDAHYWGVWHDAEPFEVLEEKIPRFMSEFGFQSLPSMETIEMFAGPGERRLDSSAMKSHQKHPRGYELIREYMERRYRVPEGFEDYVYVSQLLQADGVRIGLEAQRRAMPYCMGSLFWQLNDCWPAVSWSSMDFSGRWKALHYAARSAFEPLLVSIEADGAQVRVHLVSDRLEELSGWLTMRLMRFDGKELWRKTTGATAPANGSRAVYSVPVAELLKGADPAGVVFSAEFDCPGEKAPRALRYFVRPKDMRLPRTDIYIETVAGGPEKAVLIASSSLAKSVFLDLEGARGHFSDNFFDILPGDTLTISIDTDIPKEEIKDRITIKTLRDTY